MSDEFKLAQAVNRQAQAKALLENTMLLENLAAMDAAFVAAWRVTDRKDVLGREQCWQMMKSGEVFRNILVKSISDGKLAQAEIDQLIEKRKRAS